MLFCSGWDDDRVSCLSACCCSLCFVLIHHRSAHLISPPHNHSAHHTLYPPHTLIDWIHLCLWWSWWCWWLLFERPVLDPCCWHAVRKRRDLGVEEEPWVLSVRDGIQHCGSSSKATAGWLCLEVCHDPLPRPRRRETCCTPFMNPPAA